VGFFRKNLSNDLVPIDPENISNKDWVILLEAGTITGPSPQRIRVARWMQEKKIVKKYDMFLRTKYFIVVLHRALPDLQRMKLLLFCCRVVGTEVGILFGAIKPDL
jgi:hypothetical protein